MTWMFKNDTSEKTNEPTGTFTKMIENILFNDS
jgi:hypothetical protein